MNLGKKIKEIRKKKNLTQQELADLSGISQTYLCQIENGDRTPNLEIFENISNALGFPFPVLSFLTLDYSTIPENKLAELKSIESAVNDLIKNKFSL